MSKEPIKIRLNGKTYALNPDDPESLRQMPWSDRKQLIDLLENIKQAEYVKAAKSKKSHTDSVLSENAGSTQNTATVKPMTTGIQPENQTNRTSNAHKIDPSVKSSEKDADDLMARLIMEQKQHQKPIPDKSSVIKLMLIVFAVIIGLILIF